MGVMQREANSTSVEEEEEERRSRRRLKDNISKEGKIFTQGDANSKSKLWGVLE